MDWLVYLIVGGDTDGGAGGDSGGQGDGWGWVPFILTLIGGVFACGLVIALGQ